MIFLSHWNQSNGFVIKLVLKVRLLELLTCSCWRPRLWRRGVKRKAKLTTCAVELHLAFQLNFTSAPLRPYSRYPPSLHLLKARWDRSDVTWFLWGQTSDKSANTRNGSHVYFILDNRTFYLYDIMETYGWRDRCYFFGRNSEHRCPHSKQCNEISVKLINSGIVHLPWVKLFSRFERVNQLTVNRKNAKHENMVMSWIMSKLETNIPNRT